TQAAIDSAGVGANRARVTATRNGASATRLLPADTPTLRPHTVHVAGMAGPRRARRSADMPGLLQCGQAYMGIRWCLDMTRDCPRSPFLVKGETGRTAHARSAG